jgi:E3 ubiquitin-protein ligase makorin
MSSASTSRPVTSRPVTSRSRGICKYYQTERGCFSGRNCKFLHGTVATHTPYDQAKTCRFYEAGPYHSPPYRVCAETTRSTGFCKRGAQCWFAHTKGKEKEVIDEEDDLCSICFEKPVTYGLLSVSLTESPAIQLTF